MTQDEFQKFKMAIIGLGEMYSKNLSAQLMSMYWEALKKYDYNAVCAAIQRHYSDPEKSAFMPKPGDLIAWIAGGVEDRSQLAWAIVDRTIRVVGPYQSVVFDDPIVHAVIEQLGGWPKVCSETSEDDHKFLGHRFVKLYRANRNVTAYPRVLSGIADNENGLRGSKPQEPALIGDPQKALNVMQGGSDSNRIKITRTSHESIKKLLNHSNESNNSRPKPKLVHEVA